MARPRNRKSPARRPSDAEVQAAIERTRIRTIGWTIVGSVAGVGLMLLAAVPLAHTIAGKKTDFEVNITLSISIVATISLAISTTFAVVYRRINRRLRRRNSELENDLLKERQHSGDLERDLLDALGRVQDLEDHQDS